MNSAPGDILHVQSCTHLGTLHVHAPGDIADTMHDILIIAGATYSKYLFFEDLQLGNNFPVQQLVTTYIPCMCTCVLVTTCIPCMCTCVLVATYIPCMCTCVLVATYIPCMCTCVLGKETQLGVFYALCRCKDVCG